MLYFTLLCTLSLVYGGYRPFWLQTFSPACCEEPNTNDNCECNYGTCTWWGDPHTTTFDGVSHHFQGLAGQRYRYVSPCNSDFVTVPFQIVSRHQQCGWQNLLTCNEFVDIRLYNTVGTHVRTIRVGSGPSVTQTTTIPPGVPTLSLADGRYYYPRPGAYFEVHSYGWYVEVSVFTGLLCDSTVPRPDFIVRVNNGANRVEVDLNDYYKRYVCGLCGYWSDLQCDDFAVSWQFNPFWPVCLQFDISNLPSSMWSYTGWNWWTVNWFGFLWTDFGPNVRRLQEIPTSDDQLPRVPTDDELKGEAPQKGDENAPPEIESLANRADEFANRNVRAQALQFCGDDQNCADEIIGNFNDPDCGQNIERCFNEFVRGNNGNIADSNPDNSQTGTGTADDVRNTFERGV